jgi:cephalosporin hydroxylase
MMENLTALANRFGSDKGTVVGNPPHRYTFLYDLVFHELRHRPINLLEMGLAIGGPELGGPTERSVTSPSVLMWLAYFSKARVFGFDISDFSHMVDSRFTFVRGDSGSEGDLGRLAAAAPEYHVVIDDASHASFHQQLALKALWPRMAAGGLYVIEDLNWQSPHFETRLPRVPRTAEFFFNFLMHDLYIENQLFSREEMRRLRHGLECFAFFPDMVQAGGMKMMVLRTAQENTP